MFVVSAARALALPGHVFVVHGDVRQLSADAVLYPTRASATEVVLPGKPRAACRSRAPRSRRTSA